MYFSSILILLGLLQWGMVNSAIAAVLPDDKNLLTSIQSNLNSIDGYNSGGCPECEAQRAVKRACPSYIRDQVEGDQRSGLSPEAPKDKCQWHHEYSPKVLKTPDQVEQYFISRRGKKTYPVFGPSCLKNNWKDGLGYEHLLSDSERRLVIAEHYTSIERLESGLLASVGEISMIDSMLKEKSLSDKECKNNHFPELQVACEKINQCAPKGSLDDLAKEAQVAFSMKKVAETRLSKLDPRNPSHQKERSEIEQSLALIQSQFPWINGEFFKDLKPEGPNLYFVLALKKQFEANRKTLKERMEKYHQALRCIYDPNPSALKCRKMDTVLESTPAVIRGPQPVDKKSSAYRKWIDEKELIDFVECHEENRGIKKGWNKIGYQFMSQVAAMPVISIINELHLASKIVQGTAAAHKASKLARNAWLMRPLYYGSTYAIPGKVIFDKIQNKCSEVLKSWDQQGGENSCSMAQQSFQVQKDYSSCLMWEVAKHTPELFLPALPGLVGKYFIYTASQIGKGLKVLANGKVRTFSGQKPIVTLDIDGTIGIGTNSLQADEFSKMGLKLIGEARGNQSKIAIFPGIDKYIQYAKRRGIDIGIFSSRVKEDTDDILKEVIVLENKSLKKVIGKRSAHYDETIAQMKFNPNRAITTEFMKHNKFDRFEEATKNIPSKQQGTELEYIKNMSSVAEKDTANYLLDRENTIQGLLRSRLVRERVHNSVLVDNALGEPLKGSSVVINTSRNQIWIPTPKDGGPPVNWPHRGEYLAGITEEAIAYAKTFPGTSFNTAVGHVLKMHEVDIRNPKNWTNNYFIQRGAAALKYWLKN